MDKPNIVRNGNHDIIKTSTLIASLVIATIIFAVLISSIMHSISYAKSQSKQQEQCGGGLTVKLNLKYLHKSHPEWYENVHVRIGDAYKKKLDLSDFQKGLTVKHLDIKPGKSFEVHVDNPATDEGEQIKMENSPGCGQEKGSINIS